MINIFASTIIPHDFLYFGIHHYERWSFTKTTIGRIHWSSIVLLSFLFLKYPLLEPSGFRSRSDKEQCAVLLMGWIPAAHNSQTWAIPRGLCTSHWILMVSWWFHQFLSVFIGWCWWLDGWMIDDWWFGVIYGLKKVLVISLWLMVDGWWLMVMVGWLMIDDLESFMVWKKSLWLVYGWWLMVDGWWWWLDGWMVGWLMIWSHLWFEKSPCD